MFILFFGHPHLRTSHWLAEVISRTHSFLLSKEHIIFYKKQKKQRHLFHQIQYFIRNVSNESINFINYRPRNTVFVTWLKKELMAVCFLQMILQKAGFLEKATAIKYPSKTVGDNYLLGISLQNNLVNIFLLEFRLKLVNLVKHF